MISGFFQERNLIFVTFVTEIIVSKLFNSGKINNYI
jgi:hypothetical protein